jgi:hypothetical protein
LQGKAQAAQQVSVESDSKLPQVACNVDPAEKSIAPKGELFDFKKKHAVNSTDCVLVNNIKKLSLKSKSS